MDNNENIRFAIVATENPIHKNKYINSLVKECSENIKLIVELNFKHPKSNSFRHFKSYLYFLGIKGFTYSILQKIRQLCMILVSEILNFNDGYNLKQIAKKNGIIFKKIQDVNSDKFLKLLKASNIDYILNSANQIYKQNILEAYKNKILNRHSSLLPTYGGVHPIFWQLLNEEKMGGVTLHWIDKEIDKGTTAYQKEFKINPGISLFGHYRIAFNISLELSIQAINDLKQGIVKSIPMEDNYSYYTMPQKADVKAFKQKKLKIV